MLKPRWSTYLVTCGVGPWICWRVKWKLYRSAHRRCSPHKTYAFECLRRFTGWLVTSQMTLCRVTKPERTLLITPHSILSHWPPRAVSESSILLFKLRLTIELCVRRRRFWSNKRTVRNTYAQNECTSRILGCAVSLTYPVVTCYTVRHALAQNGRYTKYLGTVTPYGRPDRVASIP